MFYGSTNIGIKSVQGVYSGKDYYKRNVGIVMTNRYFTKVAKEKAEKLDVIMWDRAQIERMNDCIRKGKDENYDS